jgi:DNA-binding CsgD family transcriptional regulator
LSFDAPLLAPFSSLLHELYRSSHEMPVEEFQASVLGLIGRALQFDTSMWGTGAKQDDGQVAVHSIYLHEQPWEMIEGWSEFNHQDRSVEVVTAHLGYVMNVHTPTLHGGKECSGIRSLNEKFGIQTGLIVCGEAPSGLYSWLSLFRADPDRHFSENERLLFQALWPHMVEALTINRVVNLDRMHTSRQGASSCLAIADGKGIIYRAEPGFAPLMREEWPQWEGARLPAELIAIMGNGIDKGHRGTRIGVGFRRAVDLFFVSARRLGPFDRLGAREREVALQFASGRAYKEIARRVGVSPDTVRTQIQQVYRKLGVRDKGELATLLAGYE